jgi:hypothetical protein
MQLFEWIPPMLNAFHGQALEKINVSQPKVKVP